MLTFFTALKGVALASYLGLLLLVAQSKADKTSRSFFAVFLGGMLFWQFSSLMAGLAADERQALFWYNLLIAGSGTFYIIFFPFTRALLGMKGQRALAALSYIACAAVFVAGILRLPWQEAVIGRGGYWIPVYSSPWLLVFGPISYAFWLLGIVNLVRGLVREKSPVLRNRILYVLVGAVIVLVGVSTNLTPLRDYPVDIAFNLASAVIIGYAVIRYRLMDIRIMLARSLFYSVLTAMLVAAYLGTVFLLEAFLKRSLGYSGPAYGFVAVILLAILFLPLRDALQRVLDKVFFRQKIDYQKEVQAFSESISSLYERKAVLDLLRDSIDRAVKPSDISIALIEGPSSASGARAAPSPSTGAAAIALRPGSRLAEWFERSGRPIVRDEAAYDPRTRHLVDERPGPFDDPDLSVAAPIILNGKLIGSIGLGPKKSGAMYVEDDLRFLSTLATQAAIAIEKSGIFRMMRRRITQQTLLFILSEKFRGLTDFDSVMSSVISALKDFLDFETCAIAYAGKGGTTRIYANDRASEDTARIVIRDSGGRGLVRAYPLEAGGAVIGFLVAPNEAEREEGDEDFMKTIRSIIAQGMSLHRTIVDLMELERYNENVLNSLNDMGDTLIIADTDGAIRRANRAACELLGRSEEELKRMTVRDIVNGEVGPFSAAGWAELLADGSVSNYELEYLSADGRAIPMLFSGSVMRNEDESGREVVGIARDMTERIKAEEAAKNLLLVQEIHHRIKNNLQVVSSLLSLQAGYAKDETTKSMFQESMERVRSMSLIHEKLYKSGSPGGMAFGGYIRDLLDGLFRSYEIEQGKVEYSIDIGDVTLGMDTAVPCGLIVNELVTNALKHAFVAGSRGRVSVRMSRAEPPEIPGEAPKSGSAERWYELVVADDGKGLPEDFDPDSAKTLGLRIVRTLVKQLRGKMELRGENGSEFRIRFREIG